MVIPRTQAHWVAMFSWITATGGSPRSFFSVIPGIYKPTDGRTDCCNSAGTCYAMGVLGDAYCSNGWRATDGGQWWVRASGYGEPNGDYGANCFLTLWDIDTTANNLPINDASCSCVRAIGPSPPPPAVSCGRPQALDYSFFSVASHVTRG